MAIRKDWKVDRSPSREEVLRELGILLGSEPFKSAPSLTRFLRYIVEHALDGDSDQLKEYTIGVEVFDRGESFDPRTDPIVRVQARNLRQRLSRVYSGDGRDAEVLIELPKGRYVPRFSVRPATDLRNVLESLTPPTPTPSDSFTLPRREPEIPKRKWRPMIRWLGSSLMLCVFIGLIAVWVAGPSLVPTRVIRFSIPLPLVEQVFESMTPTQVAFAPDGEHIVFAANRNLYLHAMDQSETTRIYTGATDPFFSSDGQWVGFFGSGRLMKVSVSGGTPVALCQVDGDWGGSWTADDTIVFGQGARGIFRVPATGGTKELLVSVNSDKNERAHGPQILPGGEDVLFTLHSDDRNGSQIVLQSLDTGERTVLVSGAMDGTYVPTGHLVYTQAGRLMAVPFELGKRAVVRSAVPLEKALGHRGFGRRAGGQFSYSDAGALAYFSDREIDRTLVWVDRHGREESVGVEPRLYRWPRVSPDGTRLAFGVNDSGNWDLWIYDLERDISTQFTVDPADDTEPLWTPDGRHIVFSSERSGKFNLYWKAADGTGPVEHLAEGADADSWADNGKMLVFYAGGNISLLSMEGARTSQVLLEGGGAAISPDGRWLAHHRRDEAHQTRVYVRPFPNVQDAQWQVSGEGGVAPVWSPDGRELFYHTPQAVMMVPIETEPTFRPGRPQVVVSGRYLFHGMRYYDIHPDGTRFLMIKEGPQTEEINVVLNWFEELKRLVPTE